MPVIFRSFPMKIMSSGMSVLRIQKFSGCSAVKMNNIPFPACSSLRHIKPRVRERLVAATSTSTTWVPWYASVSVTFAIGNAGIS